MKKLILIAMAFAAGLLVPYLVGAFIAWEANPGAWDSAGRYVVAMFALPASMGASAIVLNILDGKG